jgi:hypothetical protein
VPEHRRVLAHRASVAASAIAAAALVASSAALGHPLSQQTTAKLPKSCPSNDVVGKTLGLTLRKRIVSYTSATYQGGGAASARAMPAGPAAVQATQKTCLYTYPNAQKSAAEGIIVPVTITFEFPVTKANFKASRKAAQHSVDPVTVKGIGDVAWVIKAPRGDPRGGNSLFVLSGTTEVVVGGPPKATVDRMTRLVRGIL